MIMISSSLVAIAAATLLAASSARPTAAFAGAGHRRRRATVLRHAPPSAAVPRRAVLAHVAAAAVAAAALPSPAIAAPKDDLLSDLRESLVQIKPIPALLEAAEWDKVRTILKTPPVGQLWNLGESKNTLVRLAKETGDFEILEMKDELAISLQMTDQYAYDNNFIYYQPGNGKVKVKEPLEMANKAISQLKEALAVVDPS